MLGRVGRFRAEHSQNTLMGEIFLPGVLLCTVLRAAYANRSPYIHCTSRVAHSKNASRQLIECSDELPADGRAGGVAISLDEVQAQLLAITLLIDAQGSQQTDTTHDTAGDQEG